MVLNDLIKKKQDHRKFLCQKSVAKGMSGLLEVGASISKNALCQKLTCVLNSSNGNTELHRL